MREFICLLFNRQLFNIIHNQTNAITKTSTFKQWKDDISKDQSFKTSKL